MKAAFEYISENQATCPTHLRPLPAYGEKARKDFKAMEGLVEEGGKCIKEDM